ncbi:phosphohistidine phosphatase SixA [Undibacterium fentianense]|uniref:Phosphohistidine phosphatase SixA n=1 Tax=Undibacterium fentianense TaxID=2828728 RepID=A0A941ICZ3_9BURK|nr:phosphohistidine phosphatase SixA [Undibacterium fentianense]MBR7799398.1 phosphohistidine phosphatase SixA [Undibacterium fentianense]
MDLILWRHAEAEDLHEGIDDHARRLTAKGQKQAQKMAYWLDSVLPDNCRILVSPALRSRETMIPLAKRMRKFKIEENIAPNADAGALLDAANWPNSRESVLLIGHQPSLGLVAAQLITPTQPECAIRKANVWWITQKERDGEGLRTYLKAIMSPDLVIKS